MIINSAPILVSLALLTTSAHHVDNNATAILESLHIHPPHPHDRDSGRSLQELCGSYDNLGFEFGNFSCWDTSFTLSTASVVPNYTSFFPPFGNYLAAIGGGCNTNMLSKTFTAQEMAAVNGMAAWVGKDPDVNDSGHIRIVQGDITLFQASGKNGNSSWVSFSYVPPAGDEGLYTLQISSTNTLDCYTPSYLLVDFQQVVQPVSNQPTKKPIAEPPLPSNQPSKNPITAQPVSNEPSKNPVTPQPVSTQPSRNPITPQPVSKQPSKNPTAQPVSNQPSRNPITPQPVSNQPSKNPTAQPVSSQPSKNPTAEPVSSQPSRNPITPQPVLIQPSKKPTADWEAPQPSNQPSKKPIAPPSHQPSNNPTASKSGKGSKASEISKTGKRYRQ